jgi:hypothetical protein
MLQQLLSCKSDLIGAGPCPMIAGLVADSGWDRPFDDPTRAASGRQFLALRDAGCHPARFPRLHAFHGGDTDCHAETLVLRSPSIS